MVVVAALSGAREARAQGAVRPGFDTTPISPDAWSGYDAIDRTYYHYSARIDFGFPINFFGRTHDGAFLNSYGALSFDGRLDFNRYINACRSENGLEPFSNPEVGVMYPALYRPLSEATEPLIAAFLSGIGGSTACIQEPWWDCNDPTHLYHSGVRPTVYYGSGLIDGHLAWGATVRD